MSLVSHMMSCKLLSGFLSMLMHGYIRVMLSSNLCLLMDRFCDLFIDRFLGSFMSFLYSLIVGLLCLFMVRCRDRWDKLVLLFL